jgi:hypothetical protein
MYQNIGLIKMDLLLWNREPPGLACDWRCRRTWCCIGIGRRRAIAYHRGVWSAVGSELNGLRGLWSDLVLWPGFG